MKTLEVSLWPLHTQCAPTYTTHTTHTPKSYSDITSPARCVPTRKLEPMRCQSVTCADSLQTKSTGRGEKSGHSHVRTVTGVASESRFRGLSQDDCSRSGLTDELTSSAFLGGLPCWRVLQLLSRHFTECEEPRAGQGRLFVYKMQALVIGGQPLNLIRSLQGYPELSHCIKQLITQPSGHWWGLGSGLFSAQTFGNSSKF